MLICSRRFGEIEVDESKIVSFPQGIPGLTQIKRFALLHHDQTHPINWLQAVDEPTVSLPVTDPFRIAGDYAFDLSDDDIKDLSLGDEKDLHVIGVLVIPPRMQEMTINLAAPILINVKLGIGKQIIMDGRKYPIRYPAFKPICRLFGEVWADAGADETGK